MIRRCSKDEYVLRINKTSFRLRIREIAVTNNQVTPSQCITMYYLSPVNRMDHWSLCRKLHCCNLSWALNEFNKYHIEKGESPFMAHRYVYNSPLFYSIKGAVKFLHFLDIRYNQEPKKRDIFIDLDLSC